MRDPNFAQANASGHWLDFPLTQYELLLAVTRQLNPIRLVRYLLARARYSAIGTEDSPYADQTRSGSPLVVLVGALFAVLIPVVAILLVLAERPLLALVAHLTVSTAVLCYYASIPHGQYAQSRINPVVSHRTTAMSRVGFLALLYGALTLISYLTGIFAWKYFLLFWVTPLATAFPLFMIAREWVQHGNADRGRLTNSRVFFVNPVVNWLVFPWGMEYHLPHHIHCSVPHYRLKALHEALLTDQVYRAKAIVVRGIFGKGSPNEPSIVEVLGPRYATAGNEFSVQDNTLELADVNDRHAIAQHCEASRRGQPTWR